MTGSGLTMAIDQLDSSVATILVTTLCSTIAGLVVSVLAYMRESRTHRWQIEQRETERLERIRDAAELKAHTAVATAVLTSKIDENTEISVSAFKEANDINRKIQAIGELRLRKDAIEHPTT